jgi:hypothetical protein
VNGPRFASAFALAPVLLASAVLASPPSETASSFVAPADRQILTRTLRKSLPGGAKIVARRSYEIWFVPDTSGFRVEGRLIAVDLDVPPGMEALAAIERQREDTDLFPMELDRLGKIVFGSTGESPSINRQAGSIALAQVAGSALSPEEQSAASSFARQLSQQGGASPWPMDLFRPQPGHREEVRPVVLPGGQEGEVIIMIDALAAGTDGVLDTVSRTVTTQLGPSIRETQEIWTLRKAEAISTP